MIKNIIFDMGNVLISYDPQRYVTSLIEDEMDAGLVVKELFHSMDWIELDCGKITEKELKNRVCHRLPERLHQSIDVLLENWHKDIPPLDGMYYLVKDLRQRGYKIYLLSNTSLRFHTFKENIPALQFFHGELISADVQMLKPGKEIFYELCSRFSIAPEECFFIDDSVDNIKTALALGMKGFCYNNNIDDLKKALYKEGVLD